MGRQQRMLSSLYTVIVLWYFPLHRGCLKLGVHILAASWEASQHTIDLAAQTVEVVNIPIGLLLCILAAQAIILTPKLMSLVHVSVTSLFPLFNWHLVCQQGKLLGSVYLCKNSPMWERAPCMFSQLSSTPKRLKAIIRLASSTAVISTW